MLSIDKLTVKSCQYLVVVKRESLQLLPHQNGRHRSARLATDGVEGGEEVEQDLTARNFYFFRLWQTQ